MNAAVLRSQDFGDLSREPVFAGILLVAFIAGVTASILAGIPGAQNDRQSQTAYPPSAERIKSAPPQISKNDPNVLSDSVSLRIVVQNPQAMPAAEEQSQKRYEPVAAAAAPLPAATLPQKATKPAASRSAAAPEPLPQVPEPHASAAVDAPLVATPMTASIFNLQLKPPPLSEIDDGAAQTTRTDTVATANAADTPDEKENARPESSSQPEAVRNGETSGLRKYLFDRMFGFMRIGPD